jgi:hypothetical protein
MKTITVICCSLCLFQAVTFGQSGSPTGKDQNPGREEAAMRAGREWDAVKNARDLARSGNVAAAENLFAGVCWGKKDSAEWHLELAQRLVQTAEELAREGEPQQVEKAVRQALGHLAQVQKKAKNAETEAAASTLAGFIHERYLADEDAAIAQYETAASRAPEAAKAAAESAERLKRTKENRSRRIGGG